MGTSPSPDGFYEPVVDLRFPKLLLIWPVVFTAWMTVFMSYVIVSGLLRDDAGSAHIPGSVLVFVMFVVLPITGVAGWARSSVRSRGRVLRVRSGFVTRMIPAEDIDGFVVVNRFGLRRDAPGLARPAIALRSGSPSDLAENPTGSRRWDRWLGIARRYLSNRRSNDLPLACVPLSIVSRRRMERALTELTRWHQWALG